MKPMFESLRKLYSGINLINAYYNANGILDEKKPVGPIKTCIDRYCSIQNIAAEIEVVINLNDEDDNFYIVVVSNTEWHTVVDRILTSSLTPSYAVIISKSLFLTGDIVSCLADLYPAYNDLLSFDPSMFVKPGAEVANIGDTLYGADISTYDYTMVLGTIALLYVNICNWWPKEDCKNALNDYLSSKDYADDTISTIIDTVLKDIDSENVFSEIISGKLVDRIYN